MDITERSEGVTNITGWRQVGELGFVDWDMLGVWRRYQSLGLRGLRNLTSQQSSVYLYGALLAHRSGDEELTAALVELARKVNPQDLLAKYLGKYIGAGRLITPPDDIIHGAFVRDAFDRLVLESGRNSLNQDIKKALAYELPPLLTDLRILGIGQSGGYSVLESVLSPELPCDFMDPTGVSQLAHEVQSPDQWAFAIDLFGMRLIGGDERIRCLQWISVRVPRMVLVEWDTKSFLVDLGPAWARYQFARYRSALAQCELRDQKLTAYAILIPKLLQDFRARRAETEHEMTSREWYDLMKLAGFREVRLRRIARHWWGEVIIVVADN